ncbi:MAG: PH domain-containing protein [Erythrobacter sp.]
MSEPVASDAPDMGVAEPLRTAPLSVVIGAVSGLSSAIVPAFIAGVSSGSGAMGLVIGLSVAVVIAVLGIVFAYIRWHRLTYTVGEQDIRVESGVLSRSARSVPYERIQDVSLKQKLLPRLFGLVAVKFETGAGGGEDLSLSFLTAAEGERLRQLVRARRDGQSVVAEQAGPQSSEDLSAADGPGEEALFEMRPNRLLVFGTFEFSLAVFAVLGGLFQYSNSFMNFDDIDGSDVADFVEGQGGWLADLTSYGQVATAIFGLVAFLVVGSISGLVRTFLREWGFLLERTDRGFRRRRGLLTKTDVVMPIHRVQGIIIGTRLLRYRFGWHNLRFVSLAQDSGSSNHVVAPFAKLDEIAPIVAAAGFVMPDETADWYRASKEYRDDSALFDGMFWLILAIIIYFAMSAWLPEWAVLAGAVPLVIGALSVAANIYAWTFHRHAFDAKQIASTRGLLSPKSQISTRLKLHSAEIAQGPIARWRGYATLHLGLAGGEFAIPGVSIERAREVRREVLKTIATTDFSQLEKD